MNSYYRIIRAPILLLILIVFCSSCTRLNKVPGDPKTRLSEYISKSFTVKSIDDRVELMSFLSGEAKTRLAAWSEDQFRQAFIDSKRQFVKLLIKEIKTVSTREVNITYELTYMDQGRGSEAKVTNKKFCQMVLDSNNRWYITDVRNLKELVEYRNEMSLP